MFRQVTLRIPFRREPVIQRTVKPNANFFSLPCGRSCSSSTERCFTNRVALSVWTFALWTLPSAAKWPPCPLSGHTYRSRSYRLTKPKWTSQKVTQMTTWSPNRPSRTNAMSGFQHDSSLLILQPKEFASRSSNETNEDLDRHDTDRQTRGHFYRWKQPRRGGTVSKGRQSAFPDKDAGHRHANRQGSGTERHGEGPCNPHRKHVHVGGQDQQQDRARAWTDG